MQKIINLLILMLFAIMSSSSIQAKSDPKILFVISAHQYGYFLPELVTPFRILHDANIHVDIASPKGAVGKAAAKGRLSDADKPYLALIEESLQHPLALSNIDTSKYDAIYFVGGSGPMMDLFDNMQISRIVNELYNDDKIISADCHGPVALANVRLKNGEFFVSNKRMTAKSNVEEGNWAKSHYPFLVEDKLRQNNAIYSAASSGVPYIVVDGNLLTGQNPASAEPLGHKLVELIKNKNSAI